MEMFYFVILLFACRCYAEDYTPWSLIPEDMGQFCTPKDVCARTSIQAGNKTESSATFSDCCTACSCKDTCGKTEPCCFPAMDKYKSNVRHRQECLPATIGRNGKLAITYHMVTKAGHDQREATNNSESTGLHCGDVNVASWGSTFPVSSISSGLIYKNHVCAEQDGVKEQDRVLWNVRFYCKWQMPSYRSILLAQLVYESLHHGNQYCTYQFYPPRHIREQVQLELCLEDVIDTCGNVTPGQFSDLGMTADQVITACESGFFSHTLKEKLYSNVFCYLCNNEGPIPNTVKCTEIMDGRSEIKFPMTMILNVEAMSSHDRTSSSKGPAQYTATACERVGGTLNKSNCRPVFCPTGQTYDAKGSCKFTFNSLNTVNVEVHVSLTLRKPLNISDVRPSRALDSWIESPWPKDWIIFKIMFKEPATFSNVSVSGQIIVSLMYKRDSISPKRLFNIMSTMIKKPFKLCTRSGTCVMLNQDFTHSRFMELSEEFIPDWYYALSYDRSPPSWTSSLLQNRPDGYKVIYELTITHLTWLAFGRTFLCQQIELMNSEYDYLPEMEILHYKQKGSILFEHEFEQFREDFGDGRIRICLENSDFDLVISGAPGWVLYTELLLSPLFMYAVIVCI